MRKENEVKGCLIEKKGRYYVILYYYVQDQRVTETKSTGISINVHKKREAERIKNQMITDKQAELEEAERTGHLRSFADCMEKWIKYKSENDLKTTSSAGYYDRSKTIVEYFREKNMMIEDLKSGDLERYYIWALKYGRRNVYKEGGSTALSYRTVKDHASLIKTFLNDAVIQGVIPKNPAYNAKLPKKGESNIEEIAYMDAEQAETFLNFLKNEPRFQLIYYISIIGFAYGLRRSEMLGLRWNAINFEKNEIEIKHTVVRVNNTVQHRDDVKTKESHRYLPISDEANRNCFLELRDWQIQHGIYSDDGYIFLWEDGREYDPDYVTKLFKKAVLACPNVPKEVTLHGLRHSCCAILFCEGWDIAEVQNWLGHADIKTTTLIYNHVNKKWKNKHGKKVDTILGKLLSSNKVPTKFRITSPHRFLA